MKRWNCVDNCNQEFLGVDRFIEAILNVCKQHGFSISHEDGHGAFEIQRGFDEHNAKWLQNAHYYPPAKEPVEG